MKVAVTAYHNNLESEVNEMFGYATWFSYLIQKQVNIN